MNPAFANAAAAAVEAHGGPSEFVPPPESVKFEINVVTYGSEFPFDAANLTRFCQQNVEGGELRPDFRILWIELERGRILRLTPGTVGASTREIVQIDEILASLRFVEAREITAVPEDWPTYRSMFGFTVHYPQHWTVIEEPAYPDRPTAGFFSVDFVNPILAAKRAEITIPVGYIPPPGAAEINFFVSKNIAIESPFNPDVLSEFCENSMGGDHNAVQLVVQETRAVGCQGNRPILPYGMLWIELSEDRTLRVMMDVAETPSDEDIAIIQMIYDSLDLSAMPD